MTRADQAYFPSPKRTLEERGLRPRKRFGQNFLIDPRFAAQVADALPPHAFVVEIGGGTGSLTEALSRRARKVLTLEIDRDLAAVLRDRFRGPESNVDVREGDALDFDFVGTLAAQSHPRAVCGNLPYNITTPLFERMVNAADTWEIGVLMVQREYAKRLVASPGTPDYGSLTAFVAYYCSVEKLFDVGAAGFYPPPAVASAVVRLVPRQNRSNGVADERLLLRTIRAAFSQRRKTLANCVEARAADGVERTAIDDAIRASELDPRVRGERLGLDDFIRLANALAKYGIELS